MTTLAELIKQKDALEAQIEATRKTELSDAIAKVKALVAEHGLKASDIFKSEKSAKKQVVDLKLLPNIMTHRVVTYGAVEAKSQSGYKEKIDQFLKFLNFLKITFYFHRNPILQFTQCF